MGDNTDPVIAKLNEVVMAQTLLKNNLEEKLEDTNNANIWLRQQLTTLLANLANNTSDSSSAFVQTTEALPRLTSIDGSHSIYDIRSIEMVEQYIDRIPNGARS